MIPWLIIAFIGGFVVCFFLVGGLAVKKTKALEDENAELKKMHVNLLIDLMNKAVFKQAKSELTKETEK